jgi:eukaryotic-like serine/threonine-protein kinase
MSQDNKGKTMIGTLAPVIPRSVPAAGPDQPTIAPGTTAPPRPPAGPAPMTTPPAPARTHPTAPPTVGMRPQADPASAVVGGAPGPSYAAAPGSYSGASGTPYGGAPGGPYAAPPGSYRGAPGTPYPGAPIAAHGPVPVSEYPGAPDPFIGQELCGYTIRRKLAEGGMGVVYEGIHTKIGRAGAIKVLKLELCRSEDVVQRFYQEARAVNSIRHENIVDIFDFGRDPEGRVFFVMEYLEGEPLSTRIKRGALAWSEAFPILDQTLRALKAAHDKGFVHRDLKPDNIWLKYVDGRVQVKLLDFGIAKLVGAESPREKLTQTGSIIGTPHYMSPEQINGARDIDHRTDIYAMGVITYEMFAGVTPFVGDTLQAIMTGHLFKDAPRLADIPANLGVPPPIAEIVERMLVKDANARYDSVAHVLADLHDVGRNLRPSNAETLGRTRPTQLAAPPPPPVGVRAGRGRGLGLAIAGAAVVGIAVGSVAFLKSRQAAVAVTTTTPTAEPIATLRPTQPVQPPAPKHPPIDYTEVRKAAQITLRNSLREAEPMVRKDGADALGKIKDQPSVAPLSQLTEHDPDAEVRGHTAAALGALGAPEIAPLLARLETGAPPPLKVWYAAALARLGDKRAVKRLLGYARSRDLAVAFKAGLALGEVSAPGDKKAIAALKAVAQLPGIGDGERIVLATRLVALHDADTRKVLYALLEGDSQDLQVAAARGLAQLGDDAGRELLRGVAAAPGANQLVAAAAQIPLGEYGGLPVITARLDDKDPVNQQIAARALGEIGEPSSLPALLALASDQDWRVRIAAAGAIVAIVGLDPVVLAQASVDWTRSALESADPALRKAAAGVLADIPAKEASKLLASAFKDKDTEVRRAASRSAGKIKTAEAAVQVAAAVQTETDPGVQEQQVKALGEIGKVGAAAAHATLVAFADKPGRLGLFAVGSLIAGGDVTGAAKLKDAAQAGQPEDLRRAAIEAAASANHDVVVPTLATGLRDRVFDIQIAAALGLAPFRAERDQVVPVLTKALDSRDPGLVGRAIAALTLLGEKIKESARTPEEMIDSPDPKQRLAAVPAVRALPGKDGVPLLRRLVADPDPDVRRAGVDAIEALVAKARDEAIKLYKPLVSDADPVVRSKAAGQLSRLAPPPPPPPPPPDEPSVTTSLPPVPAAPPDAAPPVAPSGDPAKLQVTTARQAIEQARSKAGGLDKLVADVTTAMLGAKPDDATIERVKELKAALEAGPAQLSGAASEVDEAAKALAAVEPSTLGPDDVKLVQDPGQLAQPARDAIATTRRQAAAAAKKAAEYLKIWTGNVQLMITTASSYIEIGKFAEAIAELNLAEKQVRATKRSVPSLHEAYARAHHGLAGNAQDLVTKRRLLQQAQTACEQFHRAGGGNDRSRALLTEIKEELDKLGPP